MNTFIQLLSGRLIRISDISEVVPVGPDKSSICDQNEEFYGVEIFYGEDYFISKFIDAEHRDAYMASVEAQLNPSSNKPDRLTKAVSSLSDAS